MKILFSRSNLTRKVSYQISTSIYEDENIKYVRKLAITSKSFFHLQNMNKIYLKIKKNSILVPKIINTEKNYIDFEYLPYLPIDTIIEKLIFAHEFGKTKKMLKIYLSFMHRLKEIKISPYKNRAFINHFDANKFYYQDKEESCLDQSILDYNLDNLLLDENKNELYLIDWEWAFDFPIPTNYVIFRSIFYLSSRLQTLITTFCSDDFPCYEILHDFFIPKIWWDLFNFSQKEVEKYLFYESNFQNSVNILKINFNHISILKDKKIIRQRASINLDSYLQNYIPKKDNLLDDIEKDLLNKNKQIIQLKKEKNDLVNTLNVIQSAKLFKLWQAYCKMRDNLLNKYVKDKKKT